MRIHFARSCVYFCAKQRKKKGKHPYYRISFSFINFYFLLQFSLSVLHFCFGKLIHPILCLSCAFFSSRRIILMWPSQNANLKEKDKKVKNKAQNVMVTMLIIAQNIGAEICSVCCKEITEKKKLWKEFSQKTKIITSMRSFELFKSSHIVSYLRVFFFLLIKSQLLGWTSNEEDWMISNKCLKNPIFICWYCYCKRECGPFLTFSKSLIMSSAGAKCYHWRTRISIRTFLNTFPPIS